MNSVIDQILKYQRSNNCTKLFFFKKVKTLLSPYSFDINNLKSSLNENTEKVHIFVL